jgi:hypothetical protein
VKVGALVICRRSGVTSLLEVVETGVGMSDHAQGFWVADGYDWLWFRLSEHFVRWWYPGEERPVAKMVLADLPSCAGALVRALDSIDKCARRGCDARRRPSSIWCRAHELCAASASCDNLPAMLHAADDYAALAYETAWEALADDSSLDPVTVAHCKSLRDLEVRK